MAADPHMSDSDERRDERSYTLLTLKYNLSVILVSDHVILVSDH